MEGVRLAQERMEKKKKIDQIKDRKINVCLDLVNIFLVNFFLPGIESYWSS
jgi:hypothetical protein